MKKQFLRLAIWLVVSWLAASTTLAIQGPTETKSRSFEFKYGASITDVPRGSTVRVWFPIAEQNRQQKVTRTSLNTPVAMQTNRDAVYDNLIGYFELKSENGDDVAFDISYDIVRYEAGVDDGAKTLTAQKRNRFLSANALVPIEGRPLELIQGIQMPADAMEVAHSLYNVVDAHVTYDKSKPGYGDGNVLWVCDSKTGNCTDFHSLFIALARSQSVPARFEIGFPIPNDKHQGDIGGYHCWAWFHVDGIGWTPVDISEANKHPEMKDYFFGKLTTDRVSLSSGRDIVLVPKSEAGPMNYFVYPYVEVDGKPWPKEKIDLDFSFRDQ